MRALSRRDLRAALDFVAYLGEARNLDDYALRVAFGLNAVAGGHIVGFNEINVRRNRIRWVSNVETGADYFECHRRLLPWSRAVDSRKTAGESSAPHHHIWRFEPKSRLNRLCGTRFVPR